MNIDHTLFLTIAITLTIIITVGGFTFNVYHAKLLERKQVEKCIELYQDAQTMTDYHNARNHCTRVQKQTRAFTTEHRMLLHEEADIALHRIIRDATSIDDLAQYCDVTVKYDNKDKEETHNA